MLLFGVLAALGAVLIALGIYAFPYWLAALSPAGAITLTLIPLLIGAIIQIGAIVALITHVLDRRWHEARDRVVSDLARDLSQILDNLVPILKRADPGQNAIFEDYGPVLAALRQSLNSSRMRERIPALAPAFTPDMSTFMADYINWRDELREDLALINSTQFLGFTDGHRLRSDGWRLSAVTDDFKRQFSDAELMVAWFLTLGEMLEAALETPTAGWRENTDLEHLRARISDIRDRCHPPM